VLPGIAALYVELSFGILPLLGSSAWRLLCPSESAACQVPVSALFALQLEHYASVMTVSRQKGRKVASLSFRYLGAMLIMVRGGAVLGGSCALCPGVWRGVRGVLLIMVVCGVCGG
jgi:hypothetical protein